MSEYWNKFCVRKKLRALFSKISGYIGSARAKILDPLFHWVYIPRIGINPHRFSMWLAAETIDI